MDSGTAETLSCGWNPADRRRFSDTARWT